MYCCSIIEKPLSKARVGLWDENCFFGRVNCHQHWRVHVAVCLEELLNDFERINNLNHFLIKLSHITSAPNAIFLREAEII